MEFHGVDVKRQFRRMRELAPDAYRAFLEFDQKAFAKGSLDVKTKELIALGIAHITQCPWCIDAHVQRAEKAGATEQDLAEVIFVAMAMASGAAWSHGGLALQCQDAAHKPAGGS
jgi:AhpD family alkylhydroperoxidase